MRTSPIVAVFALLLTFAAPASAQLAQPRITPPPALSEAVTMDFLHDVRVGPTAGTMMVRYNPRRSSAVTGTLLGETVQGYYYTERAPANSEDRPARSIALLRYRGATAVQAITADYDYTARNWLGMAHWLASGSGTGSASQNALGFRTVSPTPRVCLRPPCAPDATLPAVPTAPTPIVTDPLAGLNVTVGQERGPLVFRAPADGVFGGHLWGESVTGHYASPAGTVVFLRLQNGQPFQIWRGVLGAGGGGGRGFPLNASGGAPFNWTSNAQDQIVTGLRSIYDRNSCVHLENASSGPGGFVAVSNCTDASRTAWVLFSVATNRFGLASAQSGLCLNLSQTNGGRARQQPCNAGASQELAINTRILDAMGNVLRTERSPNTTHFAAASYFTVFGDAVSGGVTECMGLHVSTGNVITLTCLDDKGYWTSYY